MSKKTVMFARNTEKRIRIFFLLTPVSFETKKTSETIILNLFIRNNPREVKKFYKRLFQKCRINFSVKLFLNNALNFQYIKIFKLRYAKTCLKISKFKIKSSVIVKIFTIKKLSASLIFQLFNFIINFFIISCY